MKCVKQTGNQNESKKKKQTKKKQKKKHEYIYIYCYDTVAWYQGLSNSNALRKHLGTFILLILRNSIKKSTRRSEKTVQVPEKDHRRYSREGLPAPRRDSV